MSGPIVRKYGFPNFEKIFGERELKHGGEGQPETAPTPQPPVEPARAGSESGKIKPDAGPSKA